MIDEILTLTKSLMAIPSTADHPENKTAILDLVAKNLPKFASQTFSQSAAPSVIYTNQKTLADFKIILNAHLDVVPAKESDFTPQLKDGRLWGRGACDMKSAAAVEIQVFKHLAQKLNYPLGLQLVTDEETGGNFGTKYQLEQGIKAEFALAGDSPGFDISHAAKGIVWGDIKTTGTSAHGAYPWLGQNAITHMSDIIQNLKNTFPVPDKESWVTTINIAKINSPNTAYNRVPDECSLSFDIRYIPEDFASLDQKITSAIGSGAEIKLKKESHQYTDPQNPYLQKLLASTQKFAGPNIKLIPDHGASDIRHFQTFNIPGALMGPIGEGLHSDHEWVDINSLETFSQILTDFLLSLNN